MKLLILLVVVIGTLALFNPDEQDFSGFVTERVQTIASDNARQASGGLLGTGESPFGALARAIAANTFERTSYFVFSTYSYDFGDGLGEWKFLGIGGQFFEMDRPDLLGG